MNQLFPSAGYNYLPSLWFFSSSFTKMILRCILLSVMVGIFGVTAERSLNAKDEEEVIALWMPHVNTTSEDEYFCMGVNTAFDVRYITKYVPHASAEQVHHILIYGCSNPVKTQGASNAWKCLNDHPVQAACGGASKFLYAWAKDAPSLQLPDDVGFKIGQKTDVKGIFIQIHYSALVTNDNSGISMILTSEPRRYAAGILLMAGGGQWIPAQTPVVNVNVMCRYTDNLVIHPFGFRTHAHSLGTVISGWYMKPEDQDEGKWTLLGKQSPQNPQAFYHMDKPHNITAGTILGARCVYNSTTRSTPTIMGPTHNDEMCNFYMMYYADRNTAREGCTDVDMDLMDYQLPREASIPLPASQVMGHHHHGAMGMSGSTTSTMPPMPMPEANVTPKQTMDVAANEIGLPRRRPGMENLGENFERGKGREGEPLDNSITIAKRPDPVMGNNYQHNLGHQGEHHEHEHEHQMDQPTTGKNVVFGQPKLPNSQYMYEEVAKWSAKLGKLGQISGIALDHTDENVYIFNRRSHQWDGSSFGFDNVYTKVQEGPIAEAAIIVVDANTGAITKQFGQNMFYMPHGITVDKAGNVWVTDVALHQVMKLTDGKPTLTLGTQFQPGHDGQHFCKPTMVAVHSNGDFYVADGYCNSRVIKFTPDGRYISHFGQKEYNPLAFMGGNIQPAPEDFFIPHDIKLSDDESVLFIADRENGRVQAFNTQNLKFLRLYQVPEFGFKVFAIDTAGDLMVAVNGAADLPGESTTVQAILVNITSGSTTGVVNSPSTPLASPHAVALSRDQSCIFVVELNGNIQQFHLKGSEKLVVARVMEQKLTAKSNSSSSVLNLLASNPLSPDGSGYSFLMLAIFIVPTLILCVGLGFCCVRRNRQSSASRWKDTLYRFKPALKDGKNLVGGPRRSSREGFKPLRQEEVFDDETDSDDEVFSAQKPRRNNMA